MPRLPVTGVAINVDTATWEPLTNIDWRKIQEHVGGNFEIISHPHYTIFLNDEGALQQLPLNWGALFLFGKSIRGRVVITGPAGPEGETLPIMKRVLQHISKNYPKYKPNGENE